MAGGADRTETQSPAEMQARSARRDALFVVLQCRSPAEPPLRVRLDPGSSIVLGRGAAFGATANGREVRIDIPDSVMSSTHARLEPVLEGFAIADAGSKNGTRVAGVQQAKAVLRDGDWIEIGNTLLRFRTRIAPSDGAAIERAVTGDALATLVPDLEERFAMLGHIAKANLPVLVMGETGTGKELAARAVHERAGRTGAFVAVNCGAIAGTLLESELFGHVRGAFSGASDDRPGLIRSAHRGTLFLDEIGELPQAAQAALLRVLQQREVLPVGSDRPVPVDLAVVAATHRSLEDGIAAKTFREDLYARLAGHVLQLPPLRERMEDLGLIVARLLARAGKADATIELEAARFLIAHAWPRNVRELEMALAAALAVDPGCVKRAHLPAGADAAPIDRAEDIDRKRELEALLAEHRGNVSHVAKAMGKARSLVQKWIARYGIDAERFRR